MSYWDDDEMSETEKAYRYYRRTCPWAVKSMMYLDGYIDERGNPTITDDELLPEHGYPAEEQI